MARLPYADVGNPAQRNLVSRIVRERGSVLHLYRMLLHSSPVTEGWLGLMTAIRQQTILPGSLRELVIIRIAILNGAPYEADQHTPIAIAEGVTHRQLAALPQWQSEAELFSDEERTALALTDQMTQDIQVDESTWKAATALWSERSIVELVATIAAYNMVSRFLEALAIHPQKENEAAC